MGLDIYLYHRTADKALIEKQTEAWDAEDSRIFKLVDEKSKAEGREGWSDEDRAENQRLERESATKFNHIAVDKLNDKGEVYWTSYEHEHNRQVEIRSAKYPDHYFKIGYFRSSYNGSGINRVLSEMEVAGGLDEIMGHDGEYEFTPDWAASKKRAERALSKFIEIENSGKSYRAQSFSANPFGNASGLPKSEEDALRIFLKQLESEHSFDSYGTAEGDFWPKEPAQVFALIPGMDTGFAPRPCMFAIFKQDLSFYKQALEIIIETCDYVIGQPDPENYLLHWSG